MFSTPGQRVDVETIIASEPPPVPSAKNSYSRSILSS